MAWGGGGKSETQKKFLRLKGEERQKEIRKQWLHGSRNPTKREITIHVTRVGVGGTL